MLVDYRLRQRDHLLEISRALSSELDLSDVLRIIVQASVDLISGQAGIIVLADPSDQSFRVAAIFGIPTRLLDEFPELRKGISYSTDDQREVMLEVKNQVQQLALMADQSLTELLGLPLQNGPKVLGMIYVFQAQRYSFNHDAAKLLQGFAEQAAIAINNATLYRQVITEKQRLNAILQQSADGVMILDRHLNITEFNAALSIMTGWKSEEVVGDHHDCVFQWASQKTEMDLPMARSQGWPVPGAAHLYFEGDLRCKDGGTISLGITYAPLVDQRGRMTAIIANVRDLTRYREEEQLQKTFVSVISHELKTPVSIIKGYAGTLKRNDASFTKELMHEYLETIEDEADLLTDLIDNLLEASRLQAGTFKLELNDEVYVTKLIEMTARKFSSQTDIHTFAFEFADDVKTITADERRLTQVFNNLMSNAIKYTPDGGTITCAARIIDEYVELSVSDEGIGIPEHEKHRIFQKFSRLDNALSRKTEGTGLGLFLTKSIVEAHDGKIWFQKNKEKGTTFYIRLPNA